MHSQYKSKQMSLSAGLLLTLIAMPTLSEQNQAEQEQPKRLDAVTITGDAEERLRSPGSVHKIDETTLEQWHYTDVNRILEDVPGVYLRQEEGYGLRPNIGMRGADSSRSKRITLMEDGILFAPAPYAAPAAYYFPMMPRMQAVEVFKGLSSIKYGPNSVGGAINFISRDIPDGRGAYSNGSLDLGVGSYGLANLHGFYGDSSERFGWLVEGVHMQADGFKELDNGGDTGFKKNDLMLKLRFNSDPSADVYHQFDIKLGYADEISDETYLGLTDADFDANPLRRYVISQYDLMDWTHKQASVNHFFDPGNDFTVNTTLYRRDFTRNWDKMNNFSGNAPLTSEILLDPHFPEHEVYYDLMTGEANSTGPNERILLKAQDRDFVSQGIQSEFNWSSLLAGYQNDLSIGIRYHEDEVRRDHSVREFDVRQGDIVEREEIPARLTTKNHVTAQALAVYVFNEITLGDLTLSGGLRSEYIRTEHNNLLDNITILHDDTILLPGVGINYKIVPQLRLLAGIHEGFVSVVPGSDADAQPEKSINYELGLRYTSPLLQATAMGFFSDYSNLTGTCTFALGCSAENLDLGFNTGEVDIWGLEMEMSKTFPRIFNSSLDMPLRLVYTYTGSEFKNDFSSPRPDLIDVKAGDELPNLPEHLLTVRIGLTDRLWQAALSYNYVAEMRTVAGIDEPIRRNRTDSQNVVDFSLNYQVTVRGQVYFTVNNMFNDVAIVSRRPFGARPAKPRTLLLGYKLDF